MRIFLWKCKNFCRQIMLIVFCMACGLFFSLFSVQKFSMEDGERTYYLDSSSSQGFRTQALLFSDIYRVRGESVKIRLEEEGAEKILKKYGATLVYTEEVAGVVSYYAYTPQFSDGVIVAGKKVNLHIAYKEGAREAVLGSPIIFDGY